MRPIYFLIIFFITNFNLTSYCQEYAIELVKEKVLRNGVENFIKLSIEGYDCDKTILKCDANVNYNENCKWTISNITPSVWFELEV